MWDPCAACSKGKFRRLAASVCRSGMREDPQPCCRWAARPHCTAYPSPCWTGLAPLRVHRRKSHHAYYLPYRKGKQQRGLTRARAAPRETANEPAGAFSATLRHRFWSTAGTQSVRVTCSAGKGQPLSLEAAAKRYHDPVAVDAAKFRARMHRSLAKVTSCERLC
jgi:hypothetical protein